MRTYLVPLLVALAFAARADGPVPPVAAEHPHVHQMRGDIRPDPYFWLRNREDPALAHAACAAPQASHGRKALTPSP